MLNKVAITEEGVEDLIQKIHLYMEAVDKLWGHLMGELTLTPPPLKKGAMPRQPVDGATPEQVNSALKQKLQDNVNAYHVSLFECMTRLQHLLCDKYETVTESLAKQELEHLLSCINAECPPCINAECPLLIINNLIEMAGKDGWLPGNTRIIKKELSDTRRNLVLSCAKYSKDNEQSQENRGPSCSGF